MDKPLAGIRVVELGTFVAIPKAARLMADWGAEVIKIESPVGDAWRSIGRSWGVPYSSDHNPLFQTENANKKSLVVDLKSNQGAEVFHRLMESSDVFMTNIRIQALKRLGIDYESLKGRYPRLIYMELTGYGDQGPDRDNPAFDTAAFWGMNGSLIEWSREGELPVNPLPGFGDGTCGSLILSGILAAIIKRARTGTGDIVRTSLYVSGLWYNSNGVIMGQPRYGKRFPKKDEDLTNAFAALYQTRDEDWLILSTLTWDVHVRGVFKLLGLEQYLDNPDYIELERTRSHLSEIVAILRAAFRKIGTAEAVAGLKAIDMVHAILIHPRDVTTHPQGLSNDYFCEVALEDGEKVILPASPIRFGSMESFDFQLAPQFGADSVTILSGLGYDNEDISRMIHDGNVIVNEKI